MLKVNILNVDPITVYNECIIDAYWCTYSISGN